MTEPIATPAWRTWNASERDASTPFDLVYPRFHDRHKGLRSRDATRMDFSFSDGTPITNGNWITFFGSSPARTIWIPPWAKRDGDKSVALVLGLTASVDPITTGNGTGVTLKIRINIGGVGAPMEFGDPHALLEYFTDPSGTPKGADGGTDDAGPSEAGPRRVAFWAIPETGDWADTEQPFLLQYSTVANADAVAMVNDRVTPRSWRWEGVG